MSVIQNNGPETVDWQYLDDQTGTVLASSSMGLAQGQQATVAGVYRNAVLEIRKSGDPSWEANFLSYQSDATYDTIAGSLAAGYTLKEERAADYEAAFWMGFGLYVGLWFCTMYVKFVRAGVNQQVG